MTWAPEKTPYVMFLRGEFRPVTYLCCGYVETTDPTQATAAVVFEPPSNYYAIAVKPGDVLKRPTLSGSSYLTIE